MNNVSFNLLKVGLVLGFVCSVLLGGAILSVFTETYMIFGAMAVFLNMVCWLFLLVLPKDKLNEAAREAQKEIKDLWKASKTASIFAFIVGNAIHFCFWLPLYLTNIYIWARPKKEE